MTTNQRMAASAVLGALLVGLTACSGMTAREKDIAVGAGVGAVAGSVLTGGSTGGTLGGAAVGGVIGNEVSKDKK
jgi:osmotically inducible lipoprotein OsmB